DLLRDVTEARGDARGLLGLDFDEEMRGITAFYENALKEAAGNAALLATLEAQEAAERQQARREYWDAIMTLTKARGEALLEREAAIARQTAELSGDRAAIARQETAS